MGQSSTVLNEGFNKPSAFKKPALIIGGNGLIGSALRKSFEGDEAWRVDWSERFNPVKPGNGRFNLDLAQTGAVAAMVEEVTPKHPIEPSPYDAIYLVAAHAKVVDCEAESERTWLINADAPARIGLAALNVRQRVPPARVIFLSSDAVMRAPATNYARQKAYVESVLLPAGGIIVRLVRVDPKRVEELVLYLRSLGANGQRGQIYYWV